MRIEAINHQSSWIEESGRELGALIFNSYLSMKAKITLGERQLYVYPRGFWNRRYSIVENDQEVARIHGGFKVKLELLKPDSDVVEKTYRIHRRGFSDWSYELREEGSGRVLFRLLPDWSAERMAYDFVVEEQAIQAEEQLTELLLYCSYGHQVFRKNSSLG